MYAIVNIQGQQFKVMENTPVIIHRLEANEGEQVSFDEVLLLDNNGSVTVGSPVISGARITAKVLGHLRGDKVIIFKKKRRKTYQKSSGHRQDFTRIQVESIQG
jgi:large subunit ribosomal protein L21